MRQSFLLILLSVSLIACGAPRAQTAAVSPIPPIAITADLAQRALLDLSDLPVGWIISPAQKGNEATNQSMEFCGNGNFYNEETGLKAKPSRTFQQTSDGPYAHVQILAYGSGSEARTAFNNAVGGLRQCHEFDWHGYCTGATSPVSLTWFNEEASFPQLGEGSAAFRTWFPKTSGGCGKNGFEDEIVIVLRSQAVLLISHASNGTVYPKETQNLVNLAVEKLDRILKSAG